MVGKEPFEQIRKDTQRVYQTHAAEFEQGRNKSLFEKPWLDRFHAGFSSGAEVLDLGCGGGGVIATHLIQQGFRLTGVDFAPSMIEIAQNRHPDHTWLVQDIARLQLDTVFDGIISWNGFFHLTPDQQRQTLPTLAALLAENGRLMLTIGHEHGAVTGTVAGELVYHSSLSEAEYRQILNKAGLTQIEICLQDPTCNFHSILLASRT